jgi:acyl dehydratase
MLTPDEVAGRVYPPTSPYLVTPEKIAEFAAALGDPNPAYAGEEPIAPPTFAAVVAGRAWQALFADPELDIALDHVIHGDQQFEWNRPIKAGDRLTATLTIDELRVRGPMEFLRLSVHLATAGGEPVAISHSTLIHNRPGEGVAA